MQTIDSELHEEGRQVLCAWPRKAGSSHIIETPKKSRINMIENTPFLLLELIWHVWRPEQVVPSVDHALLF